MENVIYEKIVDSGKTWGDGETPAVVRLTHEFNFYVIWYSDHDHSGCLAIERAYGGYQHYRMIERAVEHGNMGLVRLQEMVSGK